MGKRGGGGRARGPSRRPAAGRAARQRSPERRKEPVRQASAAKAPRPSMPALPTAPVAGTVPHHREFERMNERRLDRRVKTAQEARTAVSNQPRYLVDAARGILRRVARYALAPVALARAVAERLREPERD